MAQLRAAQKKASEGNGQVQKAHGIKGRRAKIGRLPHRQAAQHKGNKKQRKHGPENHAPAPKTHNVSTDGRPHRRRQGTYQHGRPHHEPQPVKRRLFHDDIKHERKRNACACPLENPPQKKQQEIRRPGPQKSTQDEKARCREKKPLHQKPLLQVSRQRNHHRQHQEIACGNPLHQGRGNGKLLHERRKGHIHGRFNDHAGKRKNACGNDGKNKFPV